MSYNNASIQNQMWHFFSTKRTLESLINVKIEAFCPIFEIVYENFISISEHTYLKIYKYVFD